MPQVVGGPALRVRRISGNRVEGGPVIPAYFSTQKSEGGIIRAQNRSRWQYGVSTKLASKVHRGTPSHKRLRKIYTQDYRAGHLWAIGNKKS